MRSQTRTAVITGAANGLGKALALELLGKGYHLALIDIDLQGLQRMQAELRTYSISIHHADIRDEQAVIEIHRQITERHKQVDMLINNAALSISQNFEDIGLGDYRRLFEVNFWGTVYCSRYFLKDLEQRQRSYLVNIVSAFAWMGFPGKTAYASSKSAIAGFTNCLKTELHGSPVKISLVIPPPMDTGLVRDGIHTSESHRQKELDFMKKNSLPMDKIARRIIRKVEKGHYRIVIGTRVFWTDMFARIFPGITHWLIGKNKKRTGFV